MLVTVVESTALATIAYDAARQVLRLEFCSRVVYCYFGVPPAVHQSLIEAQSKGAFFNRRIRSHFPYQRLTDV
jgi:hypothetical protein